MNLPGRCAHPSRPLIELLLLDERIAVLLDALLEDDLTAVLLLLGDIEEWLLLEELSPTVELEEELLMGCKTPERQAEARQGFSGLDWLIVAFQHLLRRNLVMLQQCCRGSDRWSFWTRCRKQERR